MGKAKAPSAKDARAIGQEAALQRRRERRAAAWLPPPKPKPVDIWRGMSLYAAMAALVGFMAVRVWLSIGFALAASFLYFVPPVIRPIDEDAL